MKSLLGKLFGSQTSDDARIDRVAQLVEENARLKQLVESVNTKYTDSYNTAIRYLNGMLVRGGGEVYLDEITQEAGAKGSILSEKDKAGGVLLKFVPKEGVAA